MTEKQLEEDMRNVHEAEVSLTTDNQEYPYNTCDYRKININNMKKHVMLHKKSVACKTCQFESKDTDELIDHA